MTQVTDESTDLPDQHGITEQRDITSEPLSVSRRTVLRAGAVGVAAVGLGAGKVIIAPSLQQRGFLSRNGVLGAASQAVADSLYIEEFPVSPLILNPFNDALLFTRALRYGPAPVEVTTDKAGPYLRVLDDLVPAAAHVTEQYRTTGSKPITAA